MQIAALVPVRKGSGRVPNKNLARIGTETLLGRKLRQLKQSKMLDKVFVGTDCDQLAAEAERYEVDVIQRDPVCCDESLASANMMIADFVRRVDCDIVAWVHVTNPFVEASTYDHALERFLSNEEAGFDSLLSVHALHEHLWTSDFHPLNYNPYQSRHPLARELPPIYKQTGAFFIQRCKAMRANSYFFGKRPFLFETDDLEAFDINTLFDLKLANAVLRVMEDS